MAPRILPDPIGFVASNVGLVPVTAVAWLTSTGLLIIDWDAGHVGLAMVSIAGLEGLGQGLTARLEMMMNPNRTTTQS